MAHLIISRHYKAKEPQNTLSFVKSDDESTGAESAEEKFHILPTNKVRTEKSVRFATEEESVSAEDETSKDSLETSKDVITWLPSEHLYTDDTFIAETDGGEVTKKDSQSTAQTYGSSTFIDLDSDDETKTESIRSDTCSDSFASSDIFSSQNGSSLYKSWRDVTEIVKDIEDLEESEFVTQVDSAHLSFDEGEATDAEDSFEEQLARHEFINHTIGRLISKNEHSPRILSDDSLSSVDKDFTKKFMKRQAFSASEQKRAAKFCQQVIKTVSQKNDSYPDTKKDKKDQDVNHLLYKEAVMQKNSVLEDFGVSSNLVKQLKMENLQHAWEKKTKELDKDIEKSEQFVRDHQYVKEENVRKQFLSQTCAHILSVNTDDMIQAHLIRMPAPLIRLVKVPLDSFLPADLIRNHPVKCFAEFVRELPHQSKDVREILYAYKRQVLDRNKQTNNEH